MNGNNFDWIPFYEEFANKLISFKDDRNLLISKLLNAYNKMGLDFPFVEKDGTYFEDIDPFSVFATFNRTVGVLTKNKIIKSYKEEFDISSDVPSSFGGIPIFISLASRILGYKDERKDGDADKLWKLFAEAMVYSDENELNSDEFIKSFDNVSNIKNVKWNITIGLYWIRPNTYINLDECNRTNLKSEKISRNVRDLYVELIDDKFPSGKNYLEFCKNIKEKLKYEENNYKTLPEFSNYSWEITMKRCAAKNDNCNEKHVDYWFYSPGMDESIWNECVENNVMLFDYSDIIENLDSYNDFDKLNKKLNEIYDDGSNHKNDALMLYHIVNDLKTGDIIYAKKGKHTLLGKGKVISDDYKYDKSRDNFRYIKEVEWINVGEWYRENGFPVKTLTRIEKNNIDVVEKEIDLIMGNKVERGINNEEQYTKASFLKEVFITEEEYDALTRLLEVKKNIILQGAPGVGKTFVAKRLAYSSMGGKNDERIEYVQFHQSYSYEDFIQGYRPNGTGFELTNGIFYNFCKKAEDDKDNTYFFIIDEINRGNLSKIFGELLMLIENNKRGEKLKLLYNNEYFTVPKNLRIIGTMNTADRSLAMMDYALRRRFAFYDFKPAFENDNFKAYIASKNNEKLNSLVSMVRNLNNAIEMDESLGEGFEIGHSYFVTDEVIDDLFLKEIVQYELIPTLKEYWFDEPNKVSQWAENLRGSIK